MPEARTPSGTDETRKPRDLETRESGQREQTWKPPEILPQPNPRPGWVHRYVRTALLGQPDNVNVSQRLREGWEPCLRKDYPEIEAKSDEKSAFRDNIEIGGLILCKMPEEMYKQRQQYYDKLAKSQMDAVDSNFMRENDPRMPLLRPERHTVVTFGGKRKG